MLQQGIGTDIPLEEYITSPLASLSHLFKIEGFSMFLRILLNIFYTPKLLMSTSKV